MRRLASTALAILALAALAVPVTAATPVNVGGRDGWVSTGIAVTAGEPVSVQTLGSVHTAPIPAFHIPGVFKSASGPAGQDTNPTCGEVAATFPPELLEQTGPCALDDAYFGELIGRAGGVTFAIGDTTSFIAPASGTLELAANDLVLTYWDNTGAFTVVFR
jgi:hypothetical protein